MKKLIDLSRKISFWAMLLFLSSVSCKKSDNGPEYPKEGLVSYFNFDNNLKDVYGKTPAGTNYGNTAFTKGKHGNALIFNGTGQYIEFDRKTYKDGNKISVALWFNSGTGNQLSYFVRCNDFGVFTSEVFAGIAISIPNTNNAKGSFSSQTWTHLVGTYDGANIRTYINGVLVETKNFPGNIADAGINLKIGNSWSGSLDDLFIYNKVLSQQEVSALYNY